jgi:transposase
LRFSGVHQDFEIFALALPASNGSIASTTRGGMPIMEIVHSRCAGMDVSKRDAKVCVRVAGRGRRKAVETVRTWGSTTNAILALREDLISEQVTLVVMEATGDYWKPFYCLLEDAEFEVMLVNARQVKNLPCRKSDIFDAAWLAQLGAHGLVRGSFVPPPPIRDPAVLADLAKRRLRAKIPELTEALTGRFSDHHAFLAGMYLDAIDQRSQQIAELTARIKVMIEPFRSFCDLIGTIPGIGQRCADVIVAETGGDMSIFPTAAHLASWAGCCPGSNESAGRVKSTATRPGNPYLKAALGAAALSITNTHDTYLAAKYRRIAARRGPKKHSSRSNTRYWSQSGIWPTQARFTTMPAPTTTPAATPNVPAVTR